MGNTTYKQISNGQPITKKVGRLVYEACCDCGLTHAVFYDIETKRGKRVVVKTSYRDDYETEIQRKK